MVGDRGQYPVREIFLEHVLFVTVAVLLAMRDQLQLVLPGKLRPLDLLLLEVEPDGRQVAGGLLPAVPAARAQLQVELYLLAGCIGISKGTFQVLDVAAFLHQRGERRLDANRQRVLALEQRPVRCFARILGKRWRGNERKPESQQQNWSDHDCRPQQSYSSVPRRK